ncbi:SH3 domain-containing protein [Vreelandella hamiltonii]|nr:hypothetical protein [Halomonas johnsoniae]
MGQMIRNFIFGGVAVFAAAGIMSCKDNQELVLIAEAPVAVYEDYPSDGPPRASVIGMLEEGEVASVMHTRYAKDAAYYKVKLDSGIEGYVGWGGGFRITPVEHN